MDPLDLLDPLDASFANLALFGCSCCNRLAESHLRAGDWRVAAHWCALGRQLELDSPDAEWVAVRFKRLFHAAEAMRLAGKSEKKATGKVSRSLLLSSRSCLEACESLWARCPSCSSCPEGIYTCLAEVCWQLKDTVFRFAGDSHGARLEQVVWAGHGGSSIKLSKSVTGSKCGKQQNVGTRLIKG
ncbi:unnamed protein product [Effrenium voratum]|uniref:Uncharacterized protein n=1 Tax=Effrenium voratum TaxID=2562239 RepID=A0AA36J785_9DINO|nr:unnamed protein product [Effrenium voratum]